jgi:hypothetical protein
MDASRSSSRVTEDRGLQGFTRVSMRGVGDLAISQGERDSVSVTADRDVVGNLVTEVRDGTLVLSTKPGAWWKKVMRRHTSVRFDVTVRELEAITLSGAGDVEAGPLGGRSLAIDLSGAGDIVIESLECDEFSLDVSGSGECEIRSGQVRTQEVSVSGAGEYRAPGLVSATAAVSVSGAGEVRLTARDTLDARLSGVGSIGYHGTPEVTERVTGVGSISALDAVSEDRA